MSTGFDTPEAAASPVLFEERADVELETWQRLVIDQSSRGFRLSVLANIGNILGDQFPNSRSELIMGSTLNVSLTNELRTFVDENCGDNSLYATPSEFVRDLIRQRKAQQDAAAVRDSIIQGYEDAIRGRTKEFKGDLKALIKAAK